MAGDVELDTEVLSNRLSRLVELYDQTTTIKNRIVSLRAQQTSDVWPDVPSVQDFAQRYRDSLTSVQGQIDAIREAIDACRQALADSALSLQQQDAAIEEQLQLLANRLDRPAVAAAPGAVRSAS
ncbi:hypothetical protein [Cellulomonas sp. Marseille-Q8402]